MAAKEGTTERDVVVITGASSGIGLATALQFAEKDFNVVLAARRMDELKEVARQCEELGVEALAVMTDTSSADDVQDLAERAVEAFGRINVWINDAAVYAVGTFEETPVEDMKRLMDINFFGYVHGSQAALQQFRRQGYGTIVNVSSVNAAAPQPYIGVYGATKAAIRALDESIRMELRLDGALGDINVCTVFPAAVDTNIFQNGANYTGREIQAIEPVYDPTYVAKRIYQVAMNPKREKYVGPVGTLMALQRTHIPGVYEKQIGVFTHSDLLTDEERTVTHGNLYEPIEANRGMRGGWREKRVRADKLNMATGVAAAALVGLVGLGIFMTRKSHS